MKPEDVTRLTEIAERAATLQARRDAGRATLICRDVPYLLARLAESEARVALLEGALRDAADAAERLLTLPEDGITQSRIDDLTDPLRAALAAAPEET